MRAEVVWRDVSSIAGVCRRLAGRRPVPRIFIGCKGRHLRSIKTLVSEAVARAASRAEPCAAHTPTRPLPLLPGRLSRATTGTRRPPGQLHAESRASEIETLEIYRLRSSVTPRKLDLTTLTGPNCFLPAIKTLTCSPGSSEVICFLSSAPPFSPQMIIVCVYAVSALKGNGLWPYGTTALLCARDLRGLTSCGMHCFHAATQFYGFLLHKFSKGFAENLLTGSNLSSNHHFKY